MTVRVSKDDPNPTHHISLTDRKGRKAGFIICDQKGDPVFDNAFKISPVDRTALKTTTGNGTYADFQFPYGPVTQDDWSGGRGALDFERDNTRFYDSYRVRTSLANKAFLGPLEHFTTGHRSQDTYAPVNTIFFSLYGSQRCLAKRFPAGSSYTSALMWLVARRRGDPNDLTIAVHNDSLGAIGTLVDDITVSSSRLTDTLSEWLDETCSAAVVASQYYWFVITADADDSDTDHWEVAVKNSVGTTNLSADGSNWTAATVDLYFRLTDGVTDKNVLSFNYKEATYFAVSPITGAPKIWMNGDRGTADINTGQLNKLLDATKSWTNDQFKGAVCYKISGPGRFEPRPYHVIEGNNANSLDFTSDPWTILDDATTVDYVIVGADCWTEITGHGMTNPITDVCVSPKGVVYFCMGDAVTIKRHREWNNAGTWQATTATEWADETAATKAQFMAFQPQAQKLWIGNNVNGSSATVATVTPSTNVPDWGTAITWGTVVQIGDQYRKITQLEIYPDENGDEALWVGKEDVPFIVPTTGNPKPLSPREMESVRSPKNFAVSLVHNVYLYFPVGNGLERYYAGTLDDLGPNLGEGLPATRKGAINSLAGYPGRFFATIDAESGYSSLMERDGSGWHERWRAPKGQRIKNIAFQPVPGPTPDRMYIYCGDDIIWIPFPSDGTNELQDALYQYTYEGALTISRMHSGMFDIQKIARYIRLWADNLSKDTCWIEMDYKLNDEATWQTFNFKFEESPRSQMDLKDIFGIAFKRLQLRLRFYTSDASKTPILLALIVDAVLRISIKNFYPMLLIVADHQKDLEGSPDDFVSGEDKINLLREWADDQSDSMLLMRSISPLTDGQLVFLSSVGIDQIGLRHQVLNPDSVNRYLINVTAQDA